MRETQASRNLRDYDDMQTKKFTEIDRSKHLSNLRLQCRNLHAKLSDTTGTTRMLPPPEASENDMTSFIQACQADIVAYGIAAVPVPAVKKPDQNASPINAQLSSDDRAAAEARAVEETPGANLTEKVLNWRAAGSNIVAVAVLMTALCIASGFAQVNISAIPGVSQNSGVFPIPTNWVASGSTSNLAATINLTNGVIAQNATQQIGYIQAVSDYQTLSLSVSAQGNGPSGNGTGNVYIALSGDGGNHFEATESINQPFLFNSTNETTTVIQLGPFYGVSHIQITKISTVETNSGITALSNLWLSVNAWYPKRSAVQKSK